MDDAPLNPDAKTRWAEDRTDWAEDRTVLANERTFAGWLRTGLASVAVALGLHAVIGDFEPTWVAKAAATPFLLSALAIFLSARSGAARTSERISRHATVPQASRWLTVQVIALATGTLGTGVVLWLL